MRKAIIRLFAIIAILTIGACSNEKVPLPVIRLGHAPHDHHSPLYIAAMNPDYFREHGNTWLQEITPKKEYKLIVAGEPRATILLNCSTGGKELIRKLNENQLDLTFGGIAATLLFIDQGAAIKIVSPVMSEGTGLVISPKIPADNWKEFISYLKTRQEPLRIGYKIAFSQNLIFENALHAAGVSYSHQLDDRKVRVSMLNLYGAKNLIPALENGLIDGFVVNQPFPAIAEHLKVGRMIASFNDIPPEGYWRNHPCCVLDVRTLFYEKQPELVARLTALFRRANSFITDNQDKSAIQIAKWLDISPDVEVKSIPTINFASGRDEDWQRGTNFLISSLVKGNKLSGAVKNAFEIGKADELIYLSVPDISPATKRM